MRLFKRGSSASGQAPDPTLKTVRTGKRQSSPAALEVKLLALEALATGLSRREVAEIIGVHRRRLTDGFLQLASHYLFEAHFCTVRRGNEKGVVEGTGGYARRNFLVPVPEMADFAELNAYLSERCRRLRWTPAVSRPRGRTPFLWSASTAMATPYPYAVPTMRSRSRVTGIGW
jgi:hypothetical protein